MRIETFSVKASNARETDTGVLNGKDIDVLVMIDGLDLRGEVTLVPDHSGRYVAFGNEPSMWVSGALLAKLEKTLGPDLSEALNEIEATAAECI